MKDKWYQRLLWMLMGAVILAFFFPVTDGIKAFAYSNSNFVWLALASLTIGGIIGGIIWLLIRSETARRGLGCIVLIALFFGGFFACDEAQTLWSNQNWIGSVGLYILGALLVLFVLAAVDSIELP